MKVTKKMEMKMKSLGAAVRMVFTISKPNNLQILCVDVLSRRCLATSIVNPLPPLLLS